MKNKPTEFHHIEKENRLLEASNRESNKLLDKISTLPREQQVALEGYYKGYTSIDVARALGANRDDIEEALRQAYEELDTVGMLDNFQCLIRNKVILTYKG